MAAPSRLISHFQDRSVEDHGSAWSDLWDTDNSDLWDRGKPSPALIDLIEQRRHGLFRPLTADGRRKKVLVPGCGRGYDVVMLALHGFDAYGLDISSTGVAVAEKYASTELQKPQDYNYGDENHHNSKTGRSLRASSPPSPPPGSATFIQGDFFKPDWVNKALKDEEAKFDVIYDYTFLCALHPSMRQAWATRMADLLRSGGLLVCLEFPMYKDPTLPGPPWGLKGVHWDLLARGGDGIIANIGTEAESTAGTQEEEADQFRGQFERILYMKPPRSYESGKGTDMLSVYVRK